MTVDVRGVRLAATPVAGGRAARPPTRRLNAGKVAMMVLVASSTCGAAATAKAEVLHLRCTNPVSGASWPIVVDLDHSRVDSLPATMTDSWISWEDPERRFFDLERATGKLRMRTASATGGYFQNYTCEAK